MDDPGRRRVRRAYRLAGPALAAGWASPIFRGLVSALFDTLSLPWPWYVGGPLIGLQTALLLLLTGKGFGVSSSFQHGRGARERARRRVDVWASEAEAPARMMIG